jgi:hypothetical protein
MKRLLPILFAGLSLGLAGCAHVEVVAPAGPPVYLAATDEPQPVERRWRTWFLAWGCSPLDNTMPAEYIQREQLSTVRVIVEDNVPDALHTFIYNVWIPIGLLPQTVVVQGSRPPPETYRRRNDTK